MKFDPEILSLMKLRGLPGYILNEREFRIEDYIQSYTSTLEKLSPLKVKKQDQINALQDIMRDPTFAPYTACISSEPNDLRAKIVASQIMHEAIKQDKNAIWHTVIGGYKDDLIDKHRYHKSKVDLIILTNIIPDSTNLKLEKLRDIFELYHNIPRILITTQAEPFSFFNAMGIPLNFGVHLKSKRCRGAL